MDQGRSLFNTLFDRGDTSTTNTLDNRQHQSHQQNTTTTSTNTQYTNQPSHQGGSPSITPHSPSATANSTGPNLNEGRQNLLSLLNNSVPNAPVARDHQTRQQDPASPPVQSSIPANSQANESSGKMLLEQLMSDNPGQSAAPREKQPSSYENVQHGHTFSGHQDTPSPSRQSIFDFVSPFDAFNQPPPNQSASNRRSTQQAPAAPAAQSSGDDSSFPKQPLEGNRSDTKRNSFENLIDTLSRGSGSQQRTSGFEKGQEVSQGRTVSETRPPPARRQVPSPPLVLTQSSKPSQRGSSPSHFATRDQSQPRSEGQGIGGWKVPDNRNQQSSKDTRSHGSPSQHQSICFDVSQAMENLQVSPESSFSTPIALVKVEPTFLPGSTIGATSWIAYAMTRGRVRVISRASGDRTLLQLPSTFPPSTSVVDMAVFGNRLAGVTSDGGFIVWELPPVITDDVPGKLLLCVVPPPEPEALQSVRWHPKQPDTVAVASESKIYLINISEAFRRFGNDPVAQIDLGQVGPIITLSSPLVAFAFDVPHVAIATISEDSTLELWQIATQQPFWSACVHGESVPSSIDFLDGGIVIGRKNGTIFQLLPVMSDRVISTLKFIDTQNKDEHDMFGHVAYDARIQTLWVANSRRESIIALRLGFDNYNKEEQQTWHPRIDQILEFVGPKPSIHFVILTADSDPDGEEAEAACVAAKIDPGPLAMVAFSVHASGVDQVIIRKEWYDDAVVNALARFPPPVQIQAPIAPIARTAPVNFSDQVSVSQISTVQLPSNPRPPTPPSDTIEAEQRKEEPRTSGQARNKGKAVGFRDDNGKDNKDKVPKASETIAIDSSSNGPWAKDLRKAEENLHTRIGRTISKELERLEQRLEEARAIDRAAEMARQEQIIKLISTELTRNTTRVVELAVKAEIQSSVLPAIEAVARSEIKSVATGQLSKGFGDSLKQILPSEMERLLLRGDLSNQISKAFSSSVNPVLERQVTETITNTLIPAYSAETSTMHRELSRELRSEVMNLKKEVIAWQSDALRNHESSLREVEQTMRSMQDQLKYLSSNYASTTTSTAPHMHQHRGSPGIPTSPHTHQSHIRGDIRTGYGSPQSGYTQPSSQAWYGQSQHGSMVPPTISSSQPPAQTIIPSMTGGSGSEKAENWDESYINVLGTQDPRQLRELLSRSNPETVIPLNSHGPLSQAVVLTLIHRLSSSLGETSPVDENFKTALWWLQRAANILNPNDPLISPYVGRVLPSVKSMLNTTKSRLSLLPGGPPLMEVNRSITDIQDVITRKS